MTLEELEKIKSELRDSVNDAEARIDDAVETIIRARKRLSNTEHDITDRSFDVCKNAGLDIGVLLKIKHNGKIFNLTGKSTNGFCYVSDGVHGHLKAFEIARAINVNALEITKEAHE